MYFARSIFVTVVLIITGRAFAQMASPPANAAAAETVTVSAAISLKEALADIRGVYQPKSNVKIIFNFDASGKLAAQIEQGAPVDLFISADDQQMDKLAKGGHLVTNTRRALVYNTLVLIAPAGEADAPKSFADLAVDHGKKIAIGEPRTVPAGRYAMQTLRSMKLDAALHDRLVFGESVRQVLTYVQQGQVSGGIVYRTDAKEAGEKVKVVAVAEPDTHDKIEYPAALVTGSAHAAEARDFLEFLSGKTARAIFTARGFSIPADISASTRPLP